MSADLGLLSFTAHCPSMLVVVRLDFLTRGIDLFEMPQMFLSSIQPVPGKLDAASQPPSSGSGREAIEDAFGLIAAVHPGLFGSGS